MAIDPAAISASPAVITIVVESTAPDSPAARAKGTVRPSAMPMTTSRTVSPAVKWCSWWGVWGIRATPLKGLLPEADFLHEFLVVPEQVFLVHAQESFTIILPTFCP